MKYWKTALSIFALSASLALAEDFRTTKGKEYKDATVSRVEPDGIVIKFHGGIVKLPFTELPSDVQKKYEYDPVAAREYAAQRDRVIPGPTATPDANLRTSEADDAQSSVKALNPAEEWVVAQVTAGDVANLDTALNANHTKQFPTDSDRQLSAYFLENLLMGTLSGVTLHRHGVQIKGACIDEPIDLKNARIPCEVHLDNCTFKEPVNFRGADIAGDFAVQGAKFQNKKGGTFFWRMKVGGDAYLNAVFEGGVVFSYADIAGNLYARGAQFQSKESGVYFFGLKVRGEANFESSVFQGLVHFTKADIAGNFDASGAKFQNKEKEADFNGMKVGHDAIFKKAVFEGPVNFVLANIASSFEAQEAKFQSKEKEANFNGIRVGGDASFDKAVFEGPVNFSYADFDLLDLSNTWLKAAKVQAEAISYKYIRADPNDEGKSHEVLLELAKHTAYSADVYSRLEEFFLRHGYRSDADWAFIEGKRHERREKLHGLSWLGSLLLDGLVGYGRHPWQAGIPCAVLVALGCVLFSPKKMEPQQPEDTPRVYNRFWYSLGLFLPFVDLQSNKVWKPKADQTFLRNYMRVHILLGWILVPLLLAAVTGLIK